MVPSSSSRPSHGAAHAAAIIIAVAVLYGGTLGYPFQWDEQFFLFENPIVRGLHYYAHPGDAAGQWFEPSLDRRYIGYLSFALNYMVSGTSPTGYHVVNILIHMAASLMVWLIARRTPGASSLFAGLFFALHPLNTEAVNYVFQRLASLTALLCLSSLWLYIKASSDQRHKVLKYALSLLALSLAMKTKENAFTFPLIIVLYDLVFLEKGRRAPVHALVLLTMLIVPTEFLSADRGLMQSAATALSGATGSGATSRMEYLWAQPEAVLGYLRMAALPFGQSIDHGAVKGSAWAAIALLAVFLTAAYPLVRNFVRLETISPRIRLMSFGVMWFFIALLVESSIIPLEISMAEYRAYLPMAGLGLCCGAIWPTTLGSAMTGSATLGSGTLGSATLGSATLGSATLGSATLGSKTLGSKTLGSATMGRTAAKAFAAIVLIALALTAYERNAMWRTNATLWADASGKYPQNARARNNLAEALRHEGRLAEALAQADEAIRLSPSHSPAHVTRGLVLANMSRSIEALEAYNHALALNPSDPKTLNNLAGEHRNTGDLAAALPLYQRAVDLMPTYAEAHNNMGATLIGLGQKDAAMPYLLRAVDLKPELADAHFNLALLYLEKGDAKSAVMHLEKYLDLRPTDPEAITLMRELTGR